MNNPIAASVSDSHDLLAGERERANSITTPTTVANNQQHVTHPQPIMQAHPSPKQGTTVYSSSPASISGPPRTHSSPQHNPLMDNNPGINEQRVSPRIAWLRLQAQMRLDGVKYMDFSALIEYTRALFTDMWQLESERDYENAYLRGYMAMM
jgi:hypothetical protein